MPQKLSAADLKNQLAEALRQAESGKLVVVTRYRKPVAVLAGADRLEQLEADRSRRHAAAAGRQASRSAARGGAAVQQNARGAAAGARGRRQPAMHRLRSRAGAGATRKVLRLVRANLFRPRFTVERIQAALGVGYHDLTSEFRRATGETIYETIYKYLANRRCAPSGELRARGQGDRRLVGYGGSESFARAFKKRYGVRPSIYRELEGRLSLAVANDAGLDRPPAAPRYLAGLLDPSAGSRRAGCEGELACGPALVVFDDLAPICGDCARRRAPDLAVLLAPEATGRDPRREPGWARRIRRASGR